MSTLSSVRAEPAISGVRVLDRPDRLVVEVSAPEALRFHAQPFRSLPKVPFALLTDFEGTLRPDQARRVSVMSGGIWSVQHGLFQARPPRARVSIAAREALPYRFLASPDRRKVLIEVAKLGSRGFTGESSGVDADLVSLDAEGRPAQPRVLSGTAPRPRPVPAPAAVLTRIRATEPSQPVPMPLPPAGRRRPFTVRLSPAAVPPAPSGSTTAAAPPRAGERPGLLANSRPAPRQPSAGAVLHLAADQTEDQAEGSGPDADPAPEAAAPQADPPPPGKVRLDVENAEVADVLALVIEQTGANVVFRPEEVHGSISIRLREASVEQALGAVTRAARLAAHQEGSTYYVGKPDTIQTMFPEPSARQTYTLKQASCAEVQPALAKLFAPETGLAVLSQGPRLLVLSGPNEVVDQAMRLLPDLDVPGAEPLPDDMQVTSAAVELKYLSQDAAVQMLTELIPGASDAEDSGAAPPDSASTGGRLRIVKVPGMALPPNAGFGGMNGMSGGMGGGMSGGTSLLGTQPAPVSVSSGIGGTRAQVTVANRLLLVGPERLVKAALKALAEVDKPARQLRIEARVLDVSRGKISNHGFAWQIGQNLNVTEILPGPKAGSTAANPLRIGSLQRTTPFSIDVAIQALINENQARVLAEPSIRVLDGVPGAIFVGDILRFVVSQQATPTGNVVQIAETNVGISLNVVGRSSSDGYVTLNLSPSVSIALPNEDGLPQTRTRSVSTTVRVKSGETIVIGGLFSEQEMNSASKLPILGDLPILGNLFRSRSKNKTNSEVVIFLKTEVIPTEEAPSAEPAP